MCALGDTFDLEYIIPDKPTKMRHVLVDLFVAGGRHKLKITKNPVKSESLIHEIFLEDVGALVITELSPKKKGLFIFWKKSEEESVWSSIIIVGSDQDKCVEQLKGALATKCFPHALFKMKALRDKSVYEFQCSQSYIAVVPEDGAHKFKLKQRDIVEFTTLMSGVIYSKLKGEISSITETGSTTSQVRFRTAKHELSYTLCNGKTFNEVHREMAYCKKPRDPASPLPPTPRALLSPDTPDRPARMRPWRFPPPSADSLSQECGTVPNIQDKPFWLPVTVPLNPPVHDPPPKSGLEPYIRPKMEHIKEVCTRQDSKRFQRFRHAVKFDPTMVDVNSGPFIPTRLNEPVYRRPRLSRLLNTEPRIAAVNFSKENIENTLAECLHKIIRSGSSPESCPFGMSVQEREMFCWRLDLVENDILLGPGWKTFANHVMYLENDDLDMIDEFSCKYRCQVVEVLLDHWYKIYALNSRNCKLPAVKRTIIQVLHQMDKLDLLHRLHWVDS